MILQDRDTWTKYPVDGLKIKSSLLPKFKFLPTFKKEGPNQLTLF